jgi:hypothetical protein
MHEASPENIPVLECWGAALRRAGIDRGISREQAGGGDDGSSHTGDYAHRWEELAPGDEVERTEHKRNLEQAFAEIETEAAGFGLFGLLLRFASLFLNVFCLLVVLLSPSRTVPLSVQLRLCY